MTTTSTARASGEMATLVAGFDWARSPLGAFGEWPQSLKTMLRMALSTEHPIFIFWGEDLTCLYNDAYSRSLGPEKHPSILGKSARVAWPEIWDAISPQIELVMAGRGSTWNENHLVPIFRHGELQDVYWTYSFCPIDEPTAPTGVGGVLVIVSETTNQVRSQQQLQLATDAGEIGFWDVDMVHDRLEWPARVKAMFGISADQPVSMTDFYGGLHQDDRDRVRIAFEAALDASKRELYDVEYRTVGKEDGVVRWVAAKGRAIFDEQGTVRRVIGVAIDISRRKAVELKLRQLNDELEQKVASALAERRLLAEIVDGTDAFVQVADLDLRWLAINRSSADEFERIFGVRPTVGACMLDVLSGQPESRAAVEAVWRRALAGETFVETQAFGDVARDRRHYELRFQPLRNVQGALIGAYQFVYDVTERVRDQARLAEAEKALRQAQKMEAIGQLTGGIAHDFNNLLGAISSSVQVVKKRVSIGKLDGNERYLDMAERSVQRAASLTQRLLAFSRQQTLEPRPTDVNRLIGGLEELIRRTVGVAVSLEVVGAGGLWLTRIDPPQLESALLNLCINARDAMFPDGGRLTIETSNTWLDGPAAAQRDLPPGQYVAISVTDTGTGMTPEVIARAFDPFFTTKPTGQGTGLGLSMVYGFVRQSGGHVRICSELGQGTTLSIYLPRYAGSLDAEEDAPGTASGGNGEGECVLIVEDEETIRELLAEQLRQLGYRVAVAGDGPAALKALRSDVRVDLLVTDVGLPGGMNGRQVADAARVDRPDLKILFMTGYAQNAAIGNGLLEPGMEVVTKPFDLDVLMSKVRQLIER